MVSTKSFAGFPWSECQVLETDDKVTVQSNCLQISRNDVQKPSALELKNALRILLIFRSGKTRTGECTVATCRT